jgi:hypothetical protein
MLFDFASTYNKYLWLHFLQSPKPELSGENNYLFVECFYSWDLINLMRSISRKAKENKGRLLIKLMDFSVIFYLKFLVIPFYYLLLMKPV